MERKLKQFNYANSGKEPAKRTAALKAELSRTRPFVTAFEVSTIQSDILYTDEEVTYKQTGPWFEVTKVENRNG
jgi:hypothetical protein